MSKILEKIEKKTGIRGLPENVVNKLSNSEINSFLLELFGRESKKVTPAKVLNEFRKNRFCKTSPVNPIHFKEYEIRWLKEAEQTGFIPVQLSPLAPLGTCSAVAAVNQNNIISGVRGTEVVSDCTNVFALMIADELKKDSTRKKLKYCTTHRHVRGQYFTNPLFSAHFGLFCMATGGYDTGSYFFELESFAEHINFYLNILEKEFDKNNLHVKIEFKEENENFNNKMKSHLDYLQNRIKVKITTETTNKYYKNSRFKIFLNEEIDIADGGFTDWTQKLSGNKKQRLMVSACGLEMIYKIKNKFRASSYSSPRVSPEGVDTDLVDKIKLKSLEISLNR